MYFYVKPNFSLHHIHISNEQWLLHFFILLIIIYYSSGINSSWSRGGVFMPLNVELGWSMWVQGFSIALWIKLDPSLSLDSPINCKYLYYNAIISLCNMLEITVHCTTSYLRSL